MEGSSDSPSGSFEEGEQGSWQCYTELMKEHSGGDFIALEAEHEGKTIRSPKQLHLNSRLI